MKEQIVKIAVQQMQCGGYENLNFANIAAQLGTSRANLHHHFKNKEGLGIAATEHYILHEKLFKEAILRQHDSDIRAILSVLEEQLSDILVNRDVSNSCILSQLVHDGEAPMSVRNLAVERYREEEKQFEEQIQKSKMAGNLPDSVNEKALAFKIMGGIFGMIQMGLIKLDKSDFKRAMRGTLTSYLD